MTSPCLNLYLFLLIIATHVPSLISLSSLNEASFSPIFLDISGSRCYYINRCFHVIVNRSPVPAGGHFLCFFQHRITFFLPDSLLTIIMEILSSYRTFQFSGTYPAALIFTFCSLVGFLGLLCFIRFSFLLRCKVMIPHLFPWCAVFWPLSCCKKQQSRPASLLQLHLHRQERFL